jgi:hypothetical protein
MSEVTIIENKFNLCILRTQLGKTFTAISRIDKEIEQDNELGRSIHVIYTMNTLLNNKQFAKRLDTIENKYGKGSICVFASKYSGKYQHVSDTRSLLGLCMDKKTCPRVVIMCSNTTRYDDGVKFLEVLNCNTSLIKRAYTFHDELHEYITDSVREQLEHIHSFQILWGMIALTATPDRIWRKEGFWSHIRLIDLDEMNDLSYAGVTDMIFNCVDDFFPSPYIRPTKFDFDKLEQDVIGFIAHILSKYPNILKENTRTFIPAHVRRSSHLSVRELVFHARSDAVVIVINGVEKTLQYKDDKFHTKTIPLIADDEEVCETIARLIEHYKLQHRPIVITGLLCVGMGQTLTHKSLGTFTTAIFSHLDLTNEDTYQLIGRITGRTKEWGDKYVQTQVYCPTVFMNRCQVMEECARNMVHEYNGEIVTQADYRKPMNEMGEIGSAVKDNIREKTIKSIVKRAENTDKDHRIFDTQEDAIQFGRMIGVKFIRRSDMKAPKDMIEKYGRNPTVDELMNRMWGMDDKKPARMIPTDTNQWCVYWRPSLLIKNE